MVFCGPLTVQRHLLALLLSSPVPDLDTLLSHLFYHRRVISKPTLIAHNLARPAVQHDHVTRAWVCNLCTLPLTLRIAMAQCQPVDILLPLREDGLERTHKPSTLAQGLHLCYQHARSRPGCYDMPSVPSCVRGMCTGRSSRCLRRHRVSQGCMGPEDEVER